MYLRIIQNPSKERVDESGSVIGILIFTIVLLAVILMSSLSNIKTNSLRFLDSLNTAELIYFDFGSSELNPESFPILNSLANELNANKNLKET